MVLVGLKLRQSDPRFFYSISPPTLDFLPKCQCPEKTVFTLDSSIPRSLHIAWHGGSRRTSQCSLDCSLPIPNPGESSHFFFPCTDVEDCLESRPQEERLRRKPVIPSWQCWLLSSSFLSQDVNWTAIFWKASLALKEKQIIFMGTNDSTTHL